MSSAAAGAGKPARNDVSAIRGMALFMGDSLLDGRLAHKRQRLALAAMVLMFVLADVATAEEPITLKGHRGWVGGLAFAPDGQSLVTASADGTAKLWDIGRRSERATFSGHSDIVAAVAFSPDGRALATGS